MEGPVSFQISRSARFISMLVFLVVVVIGIGLALLPSGSLLPIIDSFVERDNDEQVTVTPSITQKPPTQTPTETPTPTNTPTATLTPTSTPTPTPRVWTREEFEYFMRVKRYSINGLDLLRTGWYLYDGAEWSDSYPCTAGSCIVYRGEVSRVIQEAFEYSNDADYWCEWACQGIYRNFGQPHYLRITKFNSLQELFGNEGKEPFCPQFTGKYQDFACNVPNPTPTPLPQTSLGWPEDVRREIEDKYLYPILSEGWSRFPPEWGGKKHWMDWPREDVEAIPDRVVCWVIANGHYHFGFSAYRPANVERDLSHDMRLELRDKLDSELGMSVDGNPPLCPGFLGMIEDNSLP